MTPTVEVDYEEAGAGQTILFVPGSCSTGSAWRPTIARLEGRYRTITTSLPGYGCTTEVRTASDTTIYPVAGALEAAVRRAASPVHLVGHSFGALAGLAVTLRDQVPIKTLTILEAPAPAVLPLGGEHEHYAAFRRMTDAYISSYRAGNSEAIASMIDFYGGSGTFASFPPTVRAYAMKTTATNILDWASAYDFAPAADELAKIDLPVTVAVGEKSHQAVVMANFLISRSIPNATFRVIKGASHFMTATHPNDVANLVESQVAPRRDDR